ncbi:hypothetical protein Acsp04_60070 [Actinomadura sp. NBRC 104425]|uniref:recombinase family protein n=1 Tax=Actinomadura sp. NBRC 104425 TaxID=3032204 RepID=UPI0024A0C1F6|nr:recombinase family protein [Actinomadura sp. NBRC 104425]GLZ15772.1 hypothetical protein Acsp04_60070 [Actinomadura sp. NBRC 104425]
MALVGLVRVSTDLQKTQRRHDAPDQICRRAAEENSGGRPATEDRPATPEALLHIRGDGMLTVRKADRLAGPIVLDNLFRRGIAAVEPLALALPDDRRRGIVSETGDGREATRSRDRVGGRRPVVDGDKRAAIPARRARGGVIRAVAAGVKVPVGVVHTLARERTAGRAPATSNAEGGSGEVPRCL